jgi:Tol biopolymer transport system component
MRRLLLLAWLPLLVACNRTYPNPFEDPTQTPTLPPPAGAALVFSSDGWASAPGRGRELMAVALDGTGLARLTFCDDGTSRLCDSAEAALAPDRTRAAVRRALDLSGDGRIDERDDASLVYVDLSRQAEAELVAASQRVSGVDWSPAGELLVYSARGGGGEDLFRTNPQRPSPDNAQQTVNLSCPSVGSVPAACDTTVAERRGRIDDSGSIATFERALGDGPSEVFIFQTTTQQFRVTSAPSGGALLPATPYREGSDADPDFAPDGRAIAFRHLTSAAGRGQWEIRSAAVNGTNLTTLVAGPAWRGAPDWGADGIVFPESDAASTRLVLIQPDGSGRRELVAFPSGYRLDNPRWLR